MLVAWPGSAARQPITITMHCVLVIKIIRTAFDREKKKEYYLLHEICIVRNEMWLRPIAWHSFVIVVVDAVAVTDAAAAAAFPQKYLVTLNWNGMQSSCAVRVHRMSPCALITTDDDNTVAMENNGTATEQKTCSFRIRN